MSDARGRAALRRAGRGVLLVLVNVLVAVALFALLEGCASTLIIAREIAQTPAVPEHLHAEHDTLLGWVNLPDVHLPDVYGPGDDVRTNVQRFRNDGAFAAAVPAGRMRVICSGDSFTFGYGVGNDETWCERLGALDPRLETVNMGMGGYGIDQAYLWYLRDGRPLDHDVHVFAFLTADFNRMKTDRFMGYGKPLLEVVSDTLAVANLPVPRTSWWARRSALHGETLSRLAIVRLMRRVLRLEESAEERAKRAEDADARLRGVVPHVFAALKTANEEKGSRLLLVYLPGVWDYQSVDATEAWRAWVAEEASRQGIPYLDLVEALRRVPPTEVADLFAPNLHFTEAGNAWAAERVHEALVRLLEATAADPLPVR